MPAQPKYRAKQLMEGVLQGARTLDDITNVPQVGAISVCELQAWIERVGCVSNLHKCRRCGLQKSFRGGLLERHKCALACTLAPKESSDSRNVQEHFQQKDGNTDKSCAHLDTVREDAHASQHATQCAIDELRRPDPGAHFLTSSGRGLGGRSLKLMACGLVEGKNAEESRGQRLKVKRQR
eukprot:1143156-Pelagomonas_calceolata.AAC.3